MKTIKIAIKNSEVFKELNKMTSYTGAKLSDDSQPGVMDRVATVEEDGALLARYWAVACSELVERLKAFVTEVDFSGEGLSLGLEVSGSYDDALTPSVGTDIYSFLVASMAGRWFRLTLPAKAEEHEGEASRLLGEVARKLYHRLRPRRGA